MAGTGSRGPQLHRRAAPNRLWVTDLTYVPTRSGMAYVCFIVDAFSRRIVGWRVASNMKTEMVLDALEMARLSRGARRLVGLITHSDAGSQFTSVRFTERLDEIGARPSIGTVADSYDNALAETTNGLYKTELVYGPDATGWDDVDELELATLSWVHWFNERPAARTLRRRAPGRVRSRVLRCHRDTQRSALKPNHRASIKPRAIQRGPIVRLRAGWAAARCGAGESRSQAGLGRTSPRGVQRFESISGRRPVQGAVSGARSLRF